MEDTLRDLSKGAYKNIATFVLILVLMEDTLRDAYKTVAIFYRDVVLILVLMEDTLRAATGHPECVRNDKS